jgi:hypothetical protein
MFQYPGPQLEPWTHPYLITTFTYRSL